MTQVRELPLPTFVRGLPLTERAVRFAFEVHAGQERTSDRAPFIVHPLEVASLLSNRSQPDQVVAAGVLHDVIEDADVSAQDVEHRFGLEVRRIVEALTDDPAIEDYAARKAALREQVARAGGEVAVVFAADKIAKVRELRAQAGHDPARFGPDSSDPAIVARLAHYDGCLEMLDRVLPSHPMVRQLRFELEVYRWLSPRTA